jgi:hypothetical protein
MLRSSTQTPRSTAPANAIAAAAPSCWIDREDQARGRIAGDREVGRMQIERQLQVVGEAAQFDEPVGLALRRTLGQRQSTGDLEHLAQIDRTEVDPCLRSLRDRGEALVTQVGPGRHRREVVVDRRAAHRRLSVAFKKSTAQVRAGGGDPTRRLSAAAQAASSGFR